MSEKVPPLYGPGRYDMENVFTYHAPKGNQAERYEFLRGYAKQFAGAIVNNCPESAERTLALRKLEEATMWANASIARNE
jgi:hypothetical protein